MIVKLIYLDIMEKILTITNCLFRQNRTRNTTKVILITHTKTLTLQLRAKEIALEDIMAASIQPPVIF